MREKILCIAVGAGIFASSCVNPPSPKISQLEDMVRSSSGTMSSQLLADLITKPRFDVAKFVDFDLFLDGKKINVYEYKTTNSDANTILFFNTLGEPNNSSVKFGEWMTRLGYNTLLVDFPGEGRSEGDKGVCSVEQNMKTIDLAADYVKNNFNGKIIFVGSSHGGEMGYHYACSANADKINSYVLHGIFIPSSDIDPFNLGAKMLTDKGEGPFTGQQIIRMWYPDKIPLGILIKPENFYTPIEKLVDIGAWKRENKSSVNLDVIPLYRTESDFKEISENPFYWLEVDTNSFLNYAKRKPDGKLTKNRPVLLLATEGDLVVPCWTRAIHVYNELRKTSDKVYFHMPGCIHYGDGGSKYIPHMAFDTDFEIVGSELDVFFRHIFFRN